MEIDDTSSPSPQRFHARLARLDYGILWRYAIWAALIVLVVVMVVISPSFRTTSNVANILQQSAMLGIVSCGMLVMMITGGFDLSVGAVGATASVTTAYFSLHTALPVAIAAGLAAGLVVGLINGAIIAKGRINAFMTTFAMASIVTGVLFVATSAAPVNSKAGWLTTLAFGQIANIPYAFIFYLLFAGATWLLLSQTKWGHYLYSVGGNREASFLSGVPVVSTQVMAFVFGGFAAAVGGLILLGQSAIGQPSAASEWPLSAIAICVIGGASLSGGEGRVHGTIAATLLLEVIANGLNLLNVSPYVQPAVTGVVILLAVGADRVAKSRESNV